MEYCLIYISATLSSITEEVLLDIVNASRQKNARLGITGVLLYINNHIVQVLEGQRQVVESLYQQIQADARHTGVRIIYSQPIAQRLFAQWSMGYETLSKSQYEEVRHILPVDAQPRLAQATDQPDILRMLKGFFLLNSR